MARSTRGLEPIEECDELLINALWQAYRAVNAPIGEDWYQVSVRRGTPLEVKLMLSDTFEAYPLGKGGRILDMPEDDLKMYIERENARRAIKVSSLITAPALSLNGEGQEGAYPVEKISEWTLQCLLNAHDIVNMPSEGLALLRRFQ